MRNQYQCWEPTTIYKNDRYQTRFAKVHVDSARQHFIIVPDEGSDRPLLSANISDVVIMHGAPQRIVMIATRFDGARIYQFEAHRLPVLPWHFSGTPDRDHQVGVHGRMSEG